jgi:hypothetical protein
MREAEHNQPASDPKSLPDPAVCRAQRVLPTLVECLVLKGYLCPYAIPFGSGLFCEHPERDRIVALTKTAEKMT